ncbi:hypothetical protein F5Y02DRAFT_405043 [Annulohypoxylon stygium]|nr:hypothetical protein F5Y02DRAFT_405043 [Annulohypoxylon stygium]
MELKNICSAIGANQGHVLSGQEDCRIDFLSLNDIRSAINEYGIRNLTLYLLGVALLQIGLWKEVAWENHEEVCSEVDNLSLGKAYNDGVKKLIYCDFGLAKADFSDPELQSAIFYGLVRDLEHSAGVASAGLCDVSSLETLRS